MVPLRFLLNHSRSSKLLQSSSCFTSPSLIKYTSMVSNQKYLDNNRHEKNNCSKQSICNHGITYISSSSLFHTFSQLGQSNSSQSQTDKDKIILMSSQMNMRLLNENSFLSWCRNAYLSSVVGIAMMEEATTSLGQTAGFGAFLVGVMNVSWGTSCHVVNLIRLRHASGMSSLTITLNVLGSVLHCLLWLFILTCYIGFLDDPEYIDKRKKRGKKKLEQDLD